MNNVNPVINPYPIPIPDPYPSRSPNIDVWLITGALVDANVTLTLIVTLFRTNTK